MRITTINLKRSRYNFVLVGLFALLSIASCERTNNDTYFSVTPRNQTISYKQDTISFQISSNINWKIICYEDWISFSTIKGKKDYLVSAAVSENTSSLARQTEILIEGEDESDSILRINLVQLPSAQFDTGLFLNEGHIKQYLAERIENCEYVNSLNVVNDKNVFEIGFLNGLEKIIPQEGVPYIYVGSNNTWIADGKDTGVFADSVLCKRIIPTVLTSGSGNLTVNGSDLGVKNEDSSSLGLIAIVNTRKHICFAFKDSQVIMIGSEIYSTYNPLLPKGKSLLKILFIGNSFTADAVWHLPAMLKASEITNISMTMAYHGGYTLPLWYTNYSLDDNCSWYKSRAGTSGWGTDGTYNYSLEDVLTSDQWDIVVIQEHTGMQDAWYWTITEQRAINGLIDIIHTHQKDNRPTICYLMSQAYGEYNKTVLPSFDSQIMMFNTIVSQVKRIISSTCIDIVLPSATAIQNLRTTRVNVDNKMDLTRDSYHLDYGISRYCAAVSLFASMISICTGVSVEGNTFRFPNADSTFGKFSTPVTDANADIAILCGVKAANNPFEITDLSSY